MTTLLTCVKTPYLHNFSSLEKLLKIIIINNWFMTNNVNYRITAQLIIYLTLSIITLFSVDDPVSNFKDVHAGCILQNVSMALVELVALIENLHRNGSFTHEKTTLNNATNKADQFCFKIFDPLILGTNFYRAWSERGWCQFFFCCPANNGPNPSTGGSSHASKFNLPGDILKSWNSVP